MLIFISYLKGKRRIVNFFTKELVLIKGISLIPFDNISVFYDFYLKIGMGNCVPDLI